ncbi:eukaryotic translation initiation factor 4E binding protein 3 [Pelomyxa schiedti]|nr:eukaryotic translation initiation factor 4E binding protein 3 [Pelomyxa schiedti]
MSTPNSNARSPRFIVGPGSKAIEIPAHANMDNLTLSTSVGGTLYGTTPGGTRLVYDRNTMLMLRGSPHAKTPPEMAFVSGITKPTALSSTTQQHSPTHGPTISIVVHKKKPTTPTVSPTVTHQRSPELKPVDIGNGMVFPME